MLLYSARQRKMISCTTVRNDKRGLQVSESERVVFFAVQSLKHETSDLISELALANSGRQFLSHPHQRLTILN